MPMSPRLLRPIASGGWTPTREAGLEFWLDAADSGSVTLNSGNVSEWRDKSGKGRHGSQTDAATQPAYTLSSLNGLNLVTFDGSNDLINIPATFFRGMTSAFSICYVFLRRGAGTGADAYRPGIGIVSSPAADRGAFHYVKNTSNFGASYPFTVGDLWTSYDLTTGPTYASDTPYIIRFESDATNWRVFRNGTQEGTTRTVGNPPSIAITHFSLAHQASPSRFSNIAMAEVFFVASQSTGLGQKAEGYLAWKWGFASSLPADHPHRNGPPRL